MATTPDDDSSTNGPQARRLRFEVNAPEGPAGGHSGRRLVTVGVLVVLVAWGGLYQTFRIWRSRVLARAAYGAREVAPAVDPLAQMVPEGVAPDDWRTAVGQTHELLVTLTGANLLDRPQMEQLRAELAARVAAARPETARTVLRSIWDDLCARAGPVLALRPRPKIL
ncbi:MAG: hypothetical protein P4L84_37480 [Isosphaeraceae bacterium]|nr:hypothetical protein [Isosphaeraceae bacterium]